MEAPCAPSVCVTGKRSAVLCAATFHAEELLVYCLYFGHIKPESVEWRFDFLIKSSCSASVFRIKRAFLIEEQKIVVKVLKAQAQSQKSK